MTAEERRVATLVEKDAAVAVKLLLRYRAEWDRDEQVAERQGAEA